MEASHVLWLSLIFIGCFANSVVLELIIKLDRGAGALMTLIQFIFVSSVLMPKFLRFRDPETGAFRIHIQKKAPFKDYLIMVLIYFVSSVSSNKAFELGINQPFNVIFRSLSLLVSYLIGMFWFNKKYTGTQLMAVLLVTVGVMITTLGEVFLKSGVAERLEQCCSSLPVWKQAYIVATNQPELGFAVSQPDIDSFWNLVKLGISTVLLSLTLVGLAVLGHLQGVSYRTYKCEPEENMFFLHLMPLPMFATLLPDLSHHFAIWNASEPITFFGIITVPTLWWLCLLNVMTQHVCLMGVNNVTRTMGTLACTFATTVRKFISLIFSVLYFHSPFTAIHTTGAVFVFVGTYLFATAQAPNEAAGAAEAEKVKKD